MRSTPLSSVLSIALLTSLTLSFLPVAFADDPNASGIEGALSYEQKSPIDEVGYVSFLDPNQQSIVRTLSKVTLYHLALGRYTMFITPPKGMSTHIYVYQNDVLVETIDRPQYSFDLTGQTVPHFVIQYSLGNTGFVGVTSDPPGVPFRLRGPNTTTEGVTPQSFDDVSVGQYSVTYLPDGCPQPPAQSSDLKNRSRVSFSIVLKCDTLQAQTNQKKETSDAFITQKIDGKDVVFTDVPRTAWFATYVFDVTKTGILSGYSDRSGHPAGIFGPDQPVTIAELAKIAHKIGSIVTIDMSAQPENLRARFQWFSPYIASAEQKGWAVFQDSHLDATRPATRAEVLETLLQAMDIPLEWPKGTVFTDVTARTPYAAAIETSATHQFITTDAGAFQPSLSVNRAELAKILSVMVQDIVKGH